MSNISRRYLLRFTATTLATLGLSQLSWRQKADRYGKVLAESTSRKLALLVGINKYSSPKTNSLKGCINDVEMQRHLLVHRFGFNPNDILVLTDDRATRQGILEAFEEHLIQQAQPDDVVVFHYSGHGSLVADPDPVIVTPNGTGVNGTFVPADSLLPAEFPQQGGVVADIMGHTLFLLMSAVKSEKFTAVLDCCHAGAGARDYQVRSRSGGPKLAIAPAEKAYQEQWLSRLDWTQDEFINRYRASVAKGVILAGTQPRQYAADARFNGFFAGIFTYLLTQYLWQQDDATAERAIAHIVSQIPANYNQAPLIEVLEESGYETQPIYLSEPVNPVANAVVTEVSGTTANLWLGGLSPNSLEALEPGVTEFKAIEGSGRVTLTSRTGLQAVGTAWGEIQPGILLQTT
jgi:metacaspase-1